MKTVRQWLGLSISLIILFVLGWMLALHFSKWPRLVSLSDLVISVALLAMGMFLQYMLWHMFVVAMTRQGTLQETFASHSLMIWSKYVPGKIWSIMGRAGYLARLTSIRFTDAMIASTAAQMVMLMTGLSCGLALIISAGGNGFNISGTKLIVLVFAGVAVVLLLVFYLNKKVRDWKNSGTRLAIGVGCSILAWISWGLGLAHLLWAVGLEGAYLRDIGIFSAASSAGLLAIITPGGLGVREGAITLLLSWYDVEPGDAALVGLLSRLWFMAGELVVFVAGIMFRYIWRI